MCTTTGQPTPCRSGPIRVVVAGDLQRTSIWEQLIGREQNDAERSSVVGAIAFLQPDLVLLTGDNVFAGGSDAQWEAFDALTGPLRAHEIPVTTAFGNHEYWYYGRQAAERHVYPRFPMMHEQHWYVVPLGVVRLVVLDSNDAFLTEETWKSQQRWFERTLAAYDADDAVRGVLVAFHHPPFTNSTVTKDEKHVQDAFLPAFQKSKKTLALLNGHVHGYERYEQDGKVYVVSGGAGGPRAKLATGHARRHDDDKFEGGTPAGHDGVVRDFHFTRYEIGEIGIAAEVHALPKGGTSWRIADRFRLSFPAR